MTKLLVIEVIGYFGIILLQAAWAIRGELTEQRFALLQVASLSLIVITVVLFSSSPEYPFGLVAGSLGVIVFTILGYPAARWIYRQMRSPKK
jgi:hypothetical protein